MAQSVRVYHWLVEAVMTGQPVETHGVHLRASWAAVLVGGASPVRKATVGAADRGEAVQREEV